MDIDDAYKVVKSIIRGFHNKELGVFCNIPVDHYLFHVLETIDPGIGMAITEMLEDLESYLSDPRPVGCDSIRFSMMSKCQWMMSYRITKRMQETAKTQEEWEALFDSEFTFSHPNAVMVRVWGASAAARMRLISEVIYDVFKELDHPKYGRQYYMIAVHVDRATEVKVPFLSVCR